jgi:hypothetical protein
VGLTTPPDRAKTRRPLLRATGTMIVLFGIAASIFGDIWKPIAYSVVGNSVYLGSLSTLFPFLPVLLIVIGAYLILESMQTPLYPSKRDLDRKL